MYTLASSSLSRAAIGARSIRSLHASASRLVGPSPLEVRLRDGLKSAMKSRDRQAATCLKVCRSGLEAGWPPCLFLHVSSIVADSQSVLADATNAAKAGPNPNDPATESAVITALRKGIDKRVCQHAQIDSAMSSAVAD